MASETPAGPPTEVRPTVRVLVWWLVGSAIVIAMVGIGVETTDRTQADLGPSVDYAQAAAIARRTVLRLQRSDGLTFGSFVRARFTTECPGTKESLLSFRASSVQRGTEVLWSVWVEHRGRRPRACNADTYTVLHQQPLGGVAEDGSIAALLQGGVVRPEGNPVRLWLDEFLEGADA